MYLGGALEGDLPRGGKWLACGNGLHGTTVGSRRDTICIFLNENTDPFILE